jgi:two-component system chemotaxis response regulator CheV
MVTAIALADKREITILDFESITFNILGDEIFDSVKGQPSTDVQANLLSKKIYIADDSHVIRKKINLLLEKTGFTDLHFFENGQLIYDAVTSGNEKVDLVLSDIEMPVMDGLTMCKTLKSSFPEIPVIIMSSMVNDQISVKCQSVHADASISKGEIDSLPLIIAKVLMK